MQDCEFRTLLSVIQLLGGNAKFVTLFGLPEDGHTFTQSNLESLGPEGLCAVSPVVIPFYCRCRVLRDGKWIGGSSVSCVMLVNRLMSLKYVAGGFEKETWTDNPVFKEKKYIAVVCTTRTRGLVWCKFRV
jgi:hypothetical protein